MATDADTEFRGTMGCTCMRLRRVTRRVTQIYDELLAPAGITSSQFALLARLRSASLEGQTPLPMWALAEHHGLDPTTLSRNLKPLFSAGLIKDSADPADRRVRMISLTAAGRRRVTNALPYWREAQRRVEAALGAEATIALNGLLELSTAKLGN